MTLRVCDSHDACATDTAVVQVAVGGGGGGPGGGDGPPSADATPEAESLALFGSGLVTLAGYALLRRRARRRV